MGKMGQLRAAVPTRMYIHLFILNIEIQSQKDFGPDKITSVKCGTADLNLTLLAVIDYHSYSNIILNMS